MRKNTYRPMRAIEAEAMGYKVDQFDLAIDAKGNEFTPRDGSGTYWLPDSSLQTDMLIARSDLAE